VMIAISNLGQPIPADTEARLANFTELLATAIANAGSRRGLARWLRSRRRCDGSRRSLRAGCRRRSWSALGRSYRCQVRIRLIPKPGLPHMMVVETAGRGCAVSARSARRELKTSRAM